MNHHIKYSLVHTAAGLILIVILLTCHAWTTPLFFITTGAIVMLWLLSVIRMIRNIKRSKGKAGTSI